MSNAPSDLPSDVVQVLLDEINQRRGLSLTKADITLASPIVASSQGRNTELRVSVPAINLNFTAFYHRLQLPTLFAGMSAAFEDEGELTTHELLIRAAVRRGLTVDLDEFIDEEIVRTGELTTVEIRPRTDSLLFVGVLTLTIGVDDGEGEVPDDAILTVEGEPIMTMEDDFILIVEEPPSGPPVNIVPPSYSGIATENQPLTIDPGEWTNNPSLSYRWYLNNVEVATTITYNVPDSIAGLQLYAVVSAYGGGETVVITMDTVIVASDSPQVISAPTITGDIRAGQTVGHTNGSWTNNPTFSVQWYRNNVMVSTNPTYAIPAGTQFQTLYVIVLATANGNTEYGYSTDYTIAAA